MNTSDCSVLFPELAQVYDIPCNLQKLRSLGYFKDAQLLQFISPQELDSFALNLFNKAKSIRVKKGTVLYTFGAEVDRSYFLLNGTIEILAKKNSKERLANYPDHTLCSTQEKLVYLEQKFNIHKDKSQILIPEFYQQKLTFKFLPFTTIYGEGYFGISDSLKNGYRPFTAIATADSQLIVIQKQVFNQTLKQLEQKRQTFILQRILSSFSQDQAEQMRPKMSHIFQTSLIRLLQSQDFLYRQTSAVKYVYFLIQGEIQMRKKIILQIPKQFIKNQSKNVCKKQVETKASKIGSGNLIGQCEVILHKKQRQFSAVSCSNKSIIIQIDPVLFQKAVSQNAHVQKQLIFSSKKKLYLWFQSFEKQSKKLKKTFFGQIEDFQSKKKQKMLNDFLNDEVGIKSQFYEIFTSDGLFYRDTFQKLQSFDFNSPNQHQKRAAIKRHKGVQPGQDPAPVTNPYVHQYDLQIEEKLLMSPKVDLTQGLQNSVQQYSSLNDQKQKKTTDKFSKTVGSSTFKTSKSLKKSKDHVNKFRQIEKDQQVYKKVLIKNGIFPIEKRIDNSNSVKAIVNHKFDEVIKKCISRKNPGLKKIEQNKRQVLIKQNYERITQNLKSKAISVSQFNSYSSQCRGTDEMRKKMKSFSKNSRNQQGQTFSKNFFNYQALQECIGVNQKPKSSNIKLRSSLSTSNNWNIRDSNNTNIRDQNNGNIRDSNNSIGKMGFYSHSASFYPKKQRIVLLNHMMKPIVYYSHEI